MTFRICIGHPDKPGAAQINVTSVDDAASLLGLNKKATIFTLKTLRNKSVRCQNSYLWMRNGIYNHKPVYWRIAEIKSIFRTSTFIIQHSMHKWTGLSTKFWSAKRNLRNNNLAQG